jgi:hypothetical protein
MSGNLRFPMRPISTGQVSQKEFSEHMAGQLESQPPPLLSRVGVENIEQGRHDDWKTIPVENGTGVSAVHFGEDPGFGEQDAPNAGHHDWMKTPIG